ncbi:MULTISPECIES: hypothetical protein [unclassified Streptomyces]|uniref:hypothetical protein n=1 Tax=unclassified Streptomyces TaxID=2593676 RepID=UPI000CD5B53F|nr:MULTISPECIES: hypothetical protein [unclassified Streptomyces]AWL39683.1 hypothetical protein B9S64_17470 [Streptomyces sp. SM18]
MTTKAHRGARTLTAGQRILVHRLTARAANWVRAGRRDDLHGIAAILGCILRLAILAAGAYGVWLLLRRWPSALWVLVPLWCWAAVRALPTAAPESAEEGPLPAEDTAAQREQLLDLIRTLIGDRPGVHLAVLLKHLQDHGQWEHREVADLRAHLVALQVPVRRSVKVAGKVASGVHRDDLPTPSPADAVPDAA